MTTQSTLKDFFKTKLKHQNTMDERKKKLSLSLNKTPTKLPKLCSNSSVSMVINLDSDDENYLDEPFDKTVTSDIIMFDTSESTVIYSPEKPNRNTIFEESNHGTPTKLIQSPAKINSSLSPESSTPNVSLTSQQSNAENILRGSSFTPTKSGTPKRKFYSPTKKRAMLRTPSKARKNIFNSLDETTNKGFIENGKDLDDKTTFMLDIISDFLKEKSLINLLNERSCNLLREVMSESNNGLKLLCNLYGRKERWFRWEEIKSVIAKKKQNIDDASCHMMLKSLLQKGIIVASNYQGYKQNLTFDEFADILRKDEILAVCKLYKLKSSGKKDGVNLLKGYAKQKSNISAYLLGTPTTSNENRILRSLAEKSGACFKISEEMRRALDELYVLMYLGMDYTIIKEKKLEYTLILNKTNMQTFPYKNIKTDNASVVFKSREEFERYLNAMSIYDQYLSETDKTGDRQRCLVRRAYEMYKDISDEEMQSYSSKPPWLYKFTPPNIYIKILEDGIKWLKQNMTEECIQLALEILSALTAQIIFRQHRKPEWYAEKALIVDKFESKSEEAASILLEGLKLEIREEAKDVVRKRAGLLARRQRGGLSAGTRAALLAHLEGEEGLERGFKAEHVYKCPMYNPGGKIKFKIQTERGVEVLEAEEFCLSHYVQTGRYTHGGHWEGRIISTIFFLLFWEEIYSPLDVPGVALCQFQQYPLDMWGEQFQNNRSPRLLQRLAQVELGDIEELVEDMRRVWDERPEDELSGINRGVGWEAVAAVSRCLGPARLAALCRRLAAHYGYSHSGFPDLTLWNEHTGEIAFVEVKTDSDRPSTKQLQWMTYLRHHGVHVEFCYVGVNTTRCRARAEPRQED